MNRINLLVKKIKLKFSFNSREYWEMRYSAQGNSGDGSYFAHAEVKAKVFNQILHDYQIKELIEFGCGDGNQLKYYKIDRYLGLDVSKTVVKKTAALYSQDLTKEFLVYDPSAFEIKGSVFKFQASASIDVIFHLVEDVIFEKYMRDLFFSGQEYVIISASNHDNNRGSSIHVRHRKFTDFVAKNMPSWKLLNEHSCCINDKTTLDSFYVYKNSATNGQEKED